MRSYSLFLVSFIFTFQLHAQALDQITETYENGTKGVGNIDKDKRRVGEWVFYNNKEQLIGKMNFKAGVPEGEKTRYVNGKLVESVFLKNNKKNGPYKAYNGTSIVTEGNFLDDKKNGEWKFYFNGKLSKTTSYKMDKKEGLEIKYPTSTSSYYYKMNYKNNQLNGPYEVRWQDGQLNTSGYYQNNKKHGEWKSYYRQMNSDKTVAKYQLKLIENFTDGKLNGIRTKYYTWTKEPVIEEEAEYKAGILDGKYRKYFSNGDLEREGYNSAGECVGLWYWRISPSIKWYYKTKVFYMKTDKKCVRSDSSPKKYTLGGTLIEE